MSDTAFLMKQLFDAASCSFTYLILCKKTKKALIIDAVDKQVGLYNNLIREYDLQLIFALDTHIHADHISGMHLLKQAHGCQLVMGAESPAKGLDRFLHDKEFLTIGEIALQTLHTPGHTPESCSFILDNNIFTGDTLLIRGTGRTDFQNGNPASSYDSLFGKLLKLPENFNIFPGHDYQGMNISTIGEELRFNPRLQISNRQEYIDLMNNLNLPLPKYIDIALPANLKCGLVD